MASAVGGVAEIPLGALHLGPPGNAHAVAAELNDVLRDADARAHAARMADVVASWFSCGGSCHPAYRQLYCELGVN